MSAPFKRFAEWWTSRPILLKIIIVNIALFLLLRIAAIFTAIAGDSSGAVISLLALPPHPSMLLSRFWTVFTYMWSHFDIWHIICNMLWLYWFGQIFLLSSTPKQLLALYIYGGLGGALTYLIATTSFPAIGGAGLIGASAAVIAIVIATAIINPDFPVRMFFLGEVKLKWIAVATIVIFTIGVTGKNAGGEIAHIGGAAVGIAYGLCYHRGIDITRPFNRAVDSIVTALHHPFAGVSHRQSPHKSSAGSRRRDTSVADDRAELDAILDKIKKSGYASLSADEKRRLFDVSKRV